MIKHTAIKYVFLFLFSGTILNCFSQNKVKIDSLEKLLVSATQDSMKVRALIHLSEEYADVDSKKAFDYANKALVAAEKLKNQNYIGRAHNNLGDLYWYKVDYASSSMHYFSALKAYEATGNKNKIASCYRNIGWTYLNKKNYNAALDYYNKALVINKELGNKEKIAENYNDIGIVYADTKRPETAIDYYKKALAIHEETGNKMGMAANLANLAGLYSQIGNSEISKELLEKAEKLALELGHKRYLAQIYSVLGPEYAKQKNYKLAIELLEKSIQLSKEIKFTESLRLAYANIALVYAGMKNYEKAFEYEVLLSDIKDTIFNDNNSRQANEMMAKYESEKKELIINSLEKDTALANEKLEREKNFKLYLIIFCLMIAVSAFFLFRSNLQKKKTNLALSSAYKEIEIKNKDITDSINYSKKIQDAILPPKELKYKLFPDAFVLFKPKDIVSGDFYWFTEKNGKKLIAACDCTGHGVPGALMSMVGNNTLNQIVNEKGITTPAEALNILHKEVIKSLKQEENSETKDGMDVALITFNNIYEIEYAGAYRPLWIVRKNALLEEIKANKFSIGNFQSSGEYQFTNHKIKLEKGDCLYIFSDGYADQFGGPEGKKFRSKKLQELFISINNKSMIEQEAILEKTIDEWKQNLNQVDDILVIGIRV